MNVKMTLTDARQKAKEKLGENGWAIRDPIASNPTVRKEARRNTSEFVGVLKDKNADNKTRRAVELAHTPQSPTGRSEGRFERCGVGTAHNCQSIHRKYY